MANIFRKAKSVAVEQWPWLQEQPCCLVALQGLSPHPGCQPPVARYTNPASFLRSLPLPCGLSAIEVVVLAASSGSLVPAWPRPPQQGHFSLQQGGRLTDRH